MSMPERTIAGTFAGLCAIGMGLGPLAPIAIIGGMLVGPKLREWLTSNTNERGGYNERPTEPRPKPSSIRRPSRPNKMRNEAYFRRNNK